MPIYEYTCQSCGHQFEELVRGDEKPACPKCGKKNLERQWSIPAAHTAGAGNSACPAQQSCGMSHCCNHQCSHGGM